MLFRIFMHTPGRLLSRIDSMEDQEEHHMYRSDMLAAYCVLR